MRTRATTLATTAFIASLALASAAQSTPLGPTYPAPGGNGFSATPLGASAGDPGGKTFSYSGFDTSQFTDLYWGPDDSVPPQTAVGETLDGTLHAMTFDTISGTTAYWNTTSPYTDPTTLGTSTQTIWLSIDITGLGPTPWITSTSVGLPAAIGAVVDDSTGANYSALLQFAVGPTLGGSTPLNSVQQPTSSNLTASSFSGAFYYTPEAIANAAEPGTVALLGASLLGVGLVTRRRTQFFGASA